MEVKDRFISVYFDINAFRFLFQTQKKQSGNWPGTLALVHSYIAHKSSK